MQECRNRWRDASWRGQRRKQRRCRRGARHLLIIFKIRGWRIYSRYPVLQAKTAGIPEERPHLPLSGKRTCSLTVQRVFIAICKHLNNQQVVVRPCRQCRFLNEERADSRQPIIEGAAELLKFILILNFCRPTANIIQLFHDTISRVKECTVSNQYTFNVTNIQGF